MDCDITTWDHEIMCPTKKIETTKFYLVFNGYAHYIPGSLLFSGLDDKLYCSFKFSSEVDYISIDSHILGINHRLYDGENNTVDSLLLIIRILLLMSVNILVMKAELKMTQIFQVLNI